MGLELCCLLPPEEIRPEDEAKYNKQVKRAAKHGDYDGDYEHK